MSLLSLVFGIAAVSSCLLLAFFCPLYTADCIPCLCMATLLKTLNSLGNQKGTHRKMYKDAEAANRLVPALVSL